MPRSGFPIATAMTLVITCWAAPLFAQQPASPTPLRTAAETTIFAPPPEPSHGEAWPAPSPRRPGALVPLYVSFGTLQVLDVHSTSRALANGAVEANPLMQGVAHSRAGMLGLKAAATGGVIYASERIWRKNKAAAVTFMIAANVGMSWVVHHNYRVGSR